MVPKNNRSETSLKTRSFHYLTLIFKELRKFIKLSQIPTSYSFVHHQSAVLKKE